MTRIVGHYVLGHSRPIIAGGYSTVALVMALHATKGWKAPEQRSRRAFPERGFQRAFDKVELPGPLPMQRLMRSRLQPIEITEKAKLRHAWYRKQKFYDALRAKQELAEAYASRPGAITPQYLEGAAS